MNRYMIEFEIFGKKMKTSASGENEETAKQKVRENIKNKVVFYKIEKYPNIVDQLKDLFNM